MMNEHHRLNDELSALKQDIFFVNHKTENCGRVLLGVAEPRNGAQF